MENWLIALENSMNFPKNRVIAIEKTINDIKES